MYSYPPITLASESPRRRDILQQLSIPHKVYPPCIDEKSSIHDPIQRVSHLALEKAKAVRPHVHTELIIASDTVVAIPHSTSYTILEKPLDEEDAEYMLRTLSSCTHEVHTGICLMHNKQPVVATDICHVSFINIDDDMLQRYLISNEWQGVAGAYRIQGLGSAFISSITGNYSTVMGLSIPTLLQLLKPHRL